MAHAAKLPAATCVTVPSLLQGTLLRVLCADSPNHDHAQIHQAAVKAAVGSWQAVLTTNVMNKVWSSASLDVAGGGGGMVA